MTPNKAFLSIKPNFQPYVKEVLEKLEAKGYKPFVVEGLRTIEQQRQKVKDGNSQTMNSYHLSGYAADICNIGEMWDKGLVRQFWMDMYDIVQSMTDVKNGHIRCGLVWDHPERVAVYRNTLEAIKAGKLTQKQGDAKINWFCDAAHIEFRKD